MTMVDLKERVVKFVTTPHFEVTLRMTITMFLSYVFTFANVRAITPIETAPLLGILGPFLVMLFPTLMFSFGSLVLPTFNVFLYCFISSNALLAIAVAGGTNWYIVGFALWAFWQCFLRWDKAQGSKVSIILIAVVFQTVLIWPTFITVQEGFTVPDPSLSPSTQQELMGFLADTVEIASSLGVGMHTLVIESGVLKGITAEITIDEDGSSSTFMAGGMWLVKGCWTFSGVNNPLASYQNMMVFTCWLIIIVGVAQLMPPFRTIRSAVWRGMIPSAMKDAAGILRLHVDQVEAQSKVDAATQGGDAEKIKSNIAPLRGKCIYHMNALFDGSLAKYTFFEPRLLTFKPAECSGAYLVQLSTCVARFASASVGIELFTHQGFSYNKVEYLQAATNLEICAKALATGDVSVLDDADLSDEYHSYDTFTMHQRTKEIFAVSRKWLTAMSPTLEGSGSSSCCSQSSLQSLKNNLIPWISVHVSHYLHLFGFIAALFKKSTWKSLFDRNSNGDFIKLMWCVKYALGMTLLLALGIHWPAYNSNYVVASASDPAKSVYAAQNGGWTIVAYCFATTQTAEGSLKKGLLRMAGTMTGAFSGWLVLLICEDGTFESQYNIYGIVTLLTVTSFIATYLGTQRGFLSRISLSDDFGFGPVYFVVTQIIIVSYGVLYFGPEGRNAITVNRMVSNLVGVAMAMVMAVIPPGNYGGDPLHTRKINNFHWLSITSVVESLLSSDVKSENFHLLSKRIQTNATNMRELAADFEKDANRLQIMPHFKIDPRLKGELGKITRDIYVASFIPRLAARILENDESRMTLREEDGVVQKKLKGILSEMKSGIQSCKLGREQSFYLPAEMPDTCVDIEFLIHTIEWLVSEMKDHEEALNLIKWGF